MRRKVLVVSILMVISFGLLACGKKAETTADTIHGDEMVAFAETEETKEEVSSETEEDDYVETDNYVQGTSEGVPLTVLVYGPQKADVRYSLERWPKGSVSIYLDGTGYMLLYADLGDGLRARVCNDANGTLLGEIPFEISDTELVFYADMSEYGDFSFDAVTSYSEIVDYDGEGGAYITYATTDVVKAAESSGEPEEPKEETSKDNPTVSNVKYLNAVYEGGAGTKLVVLAVDAQDVPITIQFGDITVNASNYEVTINDSAILQVGYSWDDDSWSELNYLKDEDMFILKNHYGGEYYPTAGSSSNGSQDSENEVDMSVLEGYLGKYTDSLANCFELTKEQGYGIKNLKLYSASGWPETIGVDGDRFYDTPTISSVKQGKDYVVVETISQYILAEGRFKFIFDGTVEVTYTGGVLQGTFTGTFTK